MPVLIKDPLFSLPVDSSRQLGDLILNESLTLEQLSEIIDDSHQATSVFNGSNSLTVGSDLNLRQIGSLMVLHRIPYTPNEPIETITSKVFTGIIIDARGKLPVHGEFVTDEAVPCFFPEVWDQNMNLIYERNMVDSALAKNQGIVQYHFDDETKAVSDRAGTNPLHIKALELYGRNRTDPVISRQDALRILTVPENVNLLKQGRIVILMDKDNLIHPVSIPVKDDSYYVIYNAVKQYFYEDETSTAQVQDTYKGILVSEDFKFVADSPELLPGEEKKVAQIAAILKKVISDKEFTILVEGHTADVGKPTGQMDLSIQRTQTIIKELTADGIPADMFTYKGYGGTKPIATNATPEGRAENRRVDITARPKATYIQRPW
jgi:outer membrane protein OmpA-like peptidoglycan-associated protein